YRYPYAFVGQVTREIGKLEAADVEILEKTTPATPPPRPIAAPAGKPTPIARPSSRAPATRPTSLAPPPPDQSANRRIITATAAHKTSDEIPTADWCKRPDHLVSAINKLLCAIHKGCVVHHGKNA